jgi:hypothetical protein
VKGDIVGGKLAGQPALGLGDGILDVCVPMAAGMPAFAHNEYWRWPDGADTSNAVPKHLEILRRAVRLMEDGSDQDAYLTRP